MKFRDRSMILLLLLCASIAPGLHAAEKKPASGPGFAMDYGPYLTSSLTSTPVVPSDLKSQAVLAHKSLNIKVGNGASVSFDTDTLRYAAGWTGEFLDLSKTHLTTPKGDGPPRPGGRSSSPPKTRPTGQRPTARLPIRATTPSPQDSGRSPRITRTTRACTSGTTASSWHTQSAPPMCSNSPPPRASMAGSHSSE